MKTTVQRTIDMTSRERIEFNGRSIPVFTHVRSAEKSAVKSRVYVHGYSYLNKVEKAEVGEATGLIDPMDARLPDRDMIRVKREVAVETLRKMGMPVEPRDLKWSAKAGCSCGCSPGFITESVMGLNIWLDA